MKIKDIMTTDVTSVYFDTKISEISRILTEMRFHAVPVVDQNDLILGIITESDFFIKNIPDLYLPSYINFIKDSRFNQVKGQDQEKMKKLFDTQASDIMTADPVSLNAEDEADEVVKLFKEKHYFTIPVVDHQKKLVGIVTLADVIKLFK